MEATALGVSPPTASCVHGIYVRAGIWIGDTDLAILVLPTVAREVPAELLDPDGQAPDTGSPVDVPIVASQSNMLNIGVFK